MELPARRIAGLGLAAALLAVSGARLEGAEADRIAKALELRAGTTVADVGAGDGQWTEHLARRVGETGRVFATEVEQDKVDRAAVRIRAAGLANVTFVLGSANETGLPDGCCQAILLRLVYHHFTDPPAMRLGLWRALRPGGRLLVVEFPPHSTWPAVAGVPDRGGHGVREEDLVREMTSDGFEVVDRQPGWDGDSSRYGVVFRRPVEDAVAPPVP
jgi:SAM-dependent methyltransferase